ncbi:MAG: hypothetical protein ABI559_10120 [Chloroflexota bacterium]
MPTAITRLAILAALTLAVAVAFLRLSPATAGPTVYELDTYRADNTNAYVTGPQLTAGQHYTVTITGTYSYWFANDWESQGVCTGETPEDMPMFLTPGVTDGKVGDDAAWHFAGPKAPLSDCDATVQHDFAVSLDGGNQIIRVPATDAGTEPNPGHVYHYDVVGQDQPVVFFVLDSKRIDNYGVLKITVEPAATPTPTPAPQTEQWGDNNCDGDVTTADVMRGFTYTLLPDKTDHIAGCPDMDQTLTVVSIGATSAEPQGAGHVNWGALLCTQATDPANELTLLRHIAGLPDVPHENLCPDTGITITFTTDS